MILRLCFIFSSVPPLEAAQIIDYTIIIPLVGAVVNDFDMNNKREIVLCKKLRKINLAKKRINKA